MWKIAVVTLVVLTAVFFILVGMYFWRLRAIGSRVGSFECAFLVGDRWRAGIATYTRGNLNWYSVSSLSMAPTKRFNRRELAILGRQDRALGTGVSSVREARCVYGDEEFLLAAADGALDGLVSWLEASPPESQHTGR